MIDRPAKEDKTLLVKKSSSFSGLAPDSPKILLNSVLLVRKLYYANRVKIFFFIIHELLNPLEIKKNSSIRIKEVKNCSRL